MGKRFPPAIVNARPTYHDLGTETMGIKKTRYRKEKELDKAQPALIKGYK
jgi:hypothetical protein